ncbi:MAG TPA: amidohydrolase family protein [Vicinamibacterales bacterium]|nr:amidohydrolase family protein [Vicinamibacterales bacterium]
MRVRFLTPFLLAACLIAQSALTGAQQAPSQPSAQKPHPVADAYASTYTPLPSRTTLIRNATILTAAGPVIERGSILLQNGKVGAVGQTVNAPADAVVIDATGKWVTPGVIDTHSHLGVYSAPGIESLQDGNEMTSPVTAEVWADHSVWPQDPQFELALAGGVTAMQILPGSGNLIGGRGVTLKNVPSRTTEGMKFPGAPAGLKMACGENPRRVYGQRNQMPSTRMGNIAVFRRTWQSAVDYRDKWKKWRDDGADAGKRPDRNLQMETLAGVLDGEILVHNHCYRADEMATMIQLSKEFGFRIASFHHGVEAYKVRDLLVQNNICASIWADWWGFKLEAYDGIRENIALVHEAKGCAVVHSDDPNGIQRLNQEAAKAMRAGWEAGMTIDRADAVRWITINPARALGIDTVTGSLEAGKNADVVIWSGDPFSVYAKAERVFIDGAAVYDRSVPQPQRDFMTGQSVTIPVKGTATNSTHSKVAVPLVKVAVPLTKIVADDGAVTAITNARIHTVSGAVIPGGTVLMRGGKILAVGADVTVPAGARVIDATNKVVTPGWIESSTHIGIVEIGLSAEGTADQTTTDKELSAAFNVQDAFNPYSTVIPVTRVEGITRAVVAPAGTGNVILGQAAMFDLAGEHVPASVTRAPIAMFAALGEAGAGLAGGSRVSAILRLREALQDAVDFHRNRVAWHAAQRRPYARGRLDLEALKPVILGDIPLAIQANRASDLLAAIRLADEFKITLVLMGAAEAWMVADEIAARKIPVVVKPLTNIPRFDALGASLENAARLQRAGVTIVLSSFDTHNARNLRQEGGNAVSYGLTMEDALRAVTLTPARTWGVSDKTGSLDVGKDADLVIWSGDPFELTTAAEHVFIRGREMSRETRQTRLLEKYRTITR